MEYLADPFNYSINQVSNNGICYLFNIISTTLLYYIMYITHRELKAIYYESNFRKSGCDIEKIPYVIFDNVFDNVMINDTIKKDLISLLDINSLDRYYILYYIFNKHGGFMVDDGNGELFVNTYTYYKTVLNSWRMRQSSGMNLDETLDNNYEIVIGNYIDECNEAHIRFLSWLYYSGIYDYLITQHDIKHATLEEMNDLKLLRGNLFIKYQLYLITIEDSNTNKTHYENQKLESAFEDNTDIESIELSDNNYNYDSENDEELKQRVIPEDLVKMNLVVFAVKLITTAKKITTKSIISIWNIVKEESIELFHPILE